MRLRCRIKVLDAFLRPVEGGAGTDTVTTHLTPGAYRVIARIGAREVSQPVQISPTSPGRRVTRPRPATSTRHCSPSVRKVSGPRHPDTLAARAGLASFTGAAGDPAAARDQYTALLAIREEVSGPRHPDTLTTRANLAYFTGAAGNPAAARDQYTALLPTLREGPRIHAPRHPRRPGGSRRLHRGGG